jgi:hypothetical protein
MTSENDAGPPAEQAPEGQAPVVPQSIWRPLLVPVVFIALLILGGTFTLIGAAILGVDSGVLSHMADSRFARGLITYLFATVTIGTAILLIVAALTSPVTKEEERRFERGKEVLSLLLGLFGTIVGFYFGSELGTAGPETSPLELTAPLLGSADLAPGQKTTITAHVSGGAPPYRFSTSLEKDAPLDYSSAVGADGWIVTDIAAPAGPGVKSFLVTLGVRDVAGRSATQTREVRVTAPP